eukprot:TRINITY_DN650_c0_g1_i3.p1 TRINITY_DN650_c0_g1~~TRINITY_DN650_c0_g1_i3.p1  ORF type:complete len:180 (+),score=33.29 TRINITY_DN650_c0_g1_i3:133-672(+)
MASKQARKKARKLRAKQRKLASTTKNLDSGSDSDVEATDSCQYRMIAANDIRKGKLVIIRDHHPCKITSLDHIKNGKHGKARVTVSGVDIFSGKKYSDFFSAKSQVKVPIVESETCTVINFGSSSATIATKSGDELKVPIDQQFEETLLSLSSPGKIVDVSFIKSMGQTCLSQPRLRRA